MIRLSKLLNAARRPTQWAALCAGVVASYEHEHFIRQIRWATVVDIGANRGQFALLARYLNPRTRIVSFEPLPEPAETFRKLFKGDSRVSLHQAAVGPNRGEVVLHVSAADDSSSLLPISELQDELFPGTREVRRELVRIGPLSDFLSRGDIAPPALLKVDVQGYELEALRGCLDHLGAFDYILVEGSFIQLYEGQPLVTDIIRFLDETGFVLADAYNMAYANGAAIQGEFAFVKEGRRRPLRRAEANL